MHESNDPVGHIIKPYACQGKNIPAMIFCRWFIWVKKFLWHSGHKFHPPKMARQWGGIFSVVKNKTRRRVANRVHGSFNRKIGRTARRSPHWTDPHKNCQIIFDPFFERDPFCCITLKTALRLSIHVSDDRVQKTTLTRSLVHSSWIWIQGLPKIWDSITLLLALYEFN